MSARKNISEEYETLGALLRLPYESLQKRVYRELAEAGFSDIRPAHSSVFRHILPQGSRVTEMAERAQMTKQSMGYLVESLEAQGYVIQVPDPDDKRAKQVLLTERGQAFQEGAVRLSREAEAELADHLGVDRMAQLRDLLQELQTVLPRWEAREDR